MLKVDPTPGSILSKNIQNRIKANKKLPKILVRENTGKKLKNIVSNFTKIGQKDNCMREKCFLCLSSENGSKGKCTIPNITYSIICQLCTENNKKTIYNGETARCSYTRGYEHLHGYFTNEAKNVLNKHHLEYHKNTVKSTNNFKMHMINVHKGPLERQTSEGVNIAQSVKERKKNSNNSASPQVIILNSKNEFHQPGLIQPKIVKNSYE